jgi:hypothetical protein
MANEDPLRGWETKVDHRLLALLDGLEERPANAARRVAVFVSFQGNLQRLRTLGLEVRSVSGAVAVANVTLSNVPRLAGAPEISFVELTRAVRPSSRRARVDDPRRRIANPAMAASVAGAAVLLIRHLGAYVARRSVGSRHGLTRASAAGVGTRGYSHCRGTPPCSSRHGSRDRAVTFR